MTEKEKIALDLLQAIREEDIRCLHGRLVAYCSEIDGDLLEKCLYEALRLNKDEFFICIIVQWLCKLTIYQDWLIEESVYGEYSRKELRGFYDTVEGCLQNHNNKELLEFWRKLKTIKKCEDIFGLLFQKVIQQENRDYFDIFMRLKIIRMNEDTPVMILKSKFDDKIKIAKLFFKSYNWNDEDSWLYLIYEINDPPNSQKQLRMLANCFEKRIDLYDLRKLMACHKKTTNQFRNFIKLLLPKLDFEYFLELMNHKVFEFNETVALASLECQCTFLKELLKHYGSLYLEVIENINHGLFGTKPEPLSYNLYTIFKETFKSQMHKNIVFDYFVTNIIPCYQNEQELSSGPDCWYSLFVLIRFSQDGAIFSELIRNYVYLFLKKKAEDRLNYPVSESKRITTFIATMIWHAFSTDYFLFLHDETNECFDFLKEQNFPFEILMLASDQSYFNKLVKIRKEARLMSLKEMARWTLRRNIRKPFHDNLMKMINDLKLPFLVEKMLNLREIMQIHGLCWKQFQVSNGEFVVYVKI
ncbi:unnamed protein product [Dimorphilus gyrociliatus]|uniref:Uncharacterized protein n=1 Tax=Dimorphilus gyrociliatus TaxID=2664684 RepID=A0A7I8VLE3_9ANNE|nr:unnamed protein product [Dimorphilus gyrociliatus]